MIRSEPSLPESLTRNAPPLLGALLEHTDALAYVTDSEGRLLFRNAALTRLLEPEVEDLQDLLQQLHADSAAQGAASEQHRQALDQGEPVTWESRIRPPRGDLQPFRWHLLPAGGDPRLLVGIGWSTAERWDLLQWVRLQAYLLERVAEAVVVVSPDNRIVHWSGGAENLLGGTAEERLQEPFSTLRPADAEPVASALLPEPAPSDGERAAEPSAPQALELLDRQGLSVTVQARLCTVPGVEGEPAGTALLLREPVQRRAADPTEAPDPEEGGEALAGLFGVNGVGVISVDSDGRVMRWNTGAMHLGGANAARAKGRRIFQEVLVTRDLTWETVTTQLRHRRRVQQPVAIRHPSGTTHHAELEAVPLAGGGALLVLTDTSETRRLGQELAWAKEATFDASLLHGMVDRLDALAAALAPDQRRLLSGLDDLLGLAQEISDGTSAEDLRTRVKELRTGRLKRELDHILYQMGEGAHQLLERARDLHVLLVPEAEAPRALDPGRVVETAVELLHHRLKGTCNVELAVDGLPRVRGMRGPLLRGLCQLLLACRASCHSPERGSAGLIHIEGHPSGARVRLEIRDNGDGFGVDIQSRLTELDHLAAQPGTGPLMVGLAREAVLAGGGSFELRGAAGAGSAFVITLPRASASARLEPLRSDLDVPKEMRAPILLIEEDDWARGALERQLALRFNVRARASVAESLPAVREGRFSAAVFDLPTPLGLGVRLAERLAEANPILFRNTVLLLPPRVPAGRLERLGRAGAVLLPRTTDPAHLATLLERLILDLTRR